MRLYPVVVSLVLLGGALLARPVQAACSLEKYAELPVTMSDLRPMIDVKINGVEARLLIDTGSFFSSLTPAAEATYHMSPEAVPIGLVIRGVGGQESTPTAVYAKDFELGGITYHRIDFLVLEKALGSDEAGLLGQNVLGGFDVEYDLANGVVRLFRPKGCNDAVLAYWVGDRAYSVVDIELGNRLAPHARTLATINGAAIHVEFDTGSPRSILSLTAAAKAGVRPADAGASSAGYVSGLGVRSFVQTWRAPFASFKLGGEEIRNMPLRFGDIDLPDADMLIGADFFLSHRVYVSNSQHKLYFTYNGGPVFNLDTPPTRAPESVAKTQPAAAQPAPADAEAPHDAEGFGRRAAAFIDKRDYVKAIDDLTQAITLAPTDPRYPYQRGLAEMASAHPFLAMSDFNQALKLKPDDIPVLLIRARLYFAAKEPAKARADLDAADQFAARDPDSRISIAAAYEHIGLYKESLGELDQWITAHPKNDRLDGALNARCWVRALLNQDLDKALADCNAALALNPGQPNLLDSRGLVRLRLGDLDKAIADYDQALRVTQIPWSLYGRGLAELKKGKTTEGQADIKAAIALDPRLPDQARAWGLNPP